MSSRREVDAQAQVHEGQGAHGVVKAEREDEMIHDSPEARENLRRLREEARQRELVKLEAQVMEAQKRHVKAEGAWEKFNAEHPLQKGTSREDAVEAARLYKAEQNTRAERIELEQKFVKACEQVETEQKPKVRSPYDDMQAHEVIAKMVDLRRVAERRELTAQEAFEKLPEVKAAVAERGEAKRKLRQCRFECEQWEKRNPMKAKMRVGEGRKLAQLEQQAQTDYEQVMQRTGVVAGDKGLQGKAQEQAGQHNQKIEQAKAELKVIRPHVERAKQEVKEKQREHDRKQRQKHRGRGHEPGGMGL